MKRVLVLGADGQLGGEFVRVLRPTTVVIGMDRPHVDVCDAAAIGHVVRDSAPDTIINCAAWNAVDLAEQEPLAALATNALAVRTLALLANEVDATLVHFSSDFVFDGTAAAPYRESDHPNPLSTYGMSKLLGEVAAETATRHYVLRLSSLYGGPGRISYIDFIANALKAGTRVRVFEDRTVSPSYSPEVVGASVRLVAVGAPYGVYHCASSDWCTWYELGLAVARLLGAPESCLEGIPFSNPPGRARRPRCCALSTAKLEAAVAPGQGWHGALAQHLGLC
jgi:dTDP-4-dehydrorhamnose reductase